MQHHKQQQHLEGTDNLLLWLELSCSYGLVAVPTPTFCMHSEPLNMESPWHPRPPSPRQARCANPRRSPLLATLNGKRRLLSRLLAAALLRAARRSPQPQPVLRLALHRLGHSLRLCAALHLCDGGRCAAALGLPMPELVAGAAAGAAVAALLFIGSHHAGEREPAAATSHQSGSEGVAATRAALMRVRNSVLCVSESQCFSAGSWSTSREKTIGTIDSV